MEKSNNDGFYVFNLLPAGIYELRVSLKGFSTGVYQNVELFVGRTTTIDPQLAPSQQAETVTVEASGAGLVDLDKIDVSRPITPAEAGKSSAQLARLRQSGDSRARRTSGDLVRSN